MKRNVLWVVSLAGAFAAGCLLSSFDSAPVVSAAESQFVVGDTYAFVGLEGGVVSGPVVSASDGWVEVKVDNVDANVYQINLDHVERYKHIVK